MNPKLFLNHTNRFYTLFLSRTFASETLSYFLSSPYPFTSRLGQRYTRTTLRAWGAFFQVPKDWEMGLRVVWDEFFLILLKFLDWETVLGTLRDVLKRRIENLCNDIYLCCKMLYKYGYYSRKFAVINHLSFWNLFGNWDYTSFILKVLNRRKSRLPS